MAKPGPKVGSRQKREPDYLSSGGAEKLAHAIRSYWKLRGYAVTAWVEEVPGRFHHGGAQYQVRTSGLVNGVPQEEMQVK